MSASALELHNKLIMAQFEYENALNSFRLSSFVETDIVPSEIELEMYYVKVDTAGVSRIYNDYFESKVNIKRAMANVESSRFFPEVSVGYTRQNILPIKNLNAWMIGVSFPLYFLPQASKVRQARLEERSARLEAEQNIRELESKLKELRSSIKKYSIGLNYYNHEGLREADELLKGAKLQLEHNETSMADFIQSVNTAREIKRAYIETLYNYNVASLEYELYK